jgi:hypothetical protein
MGRPQTLLKALHYQPELFEPLLWLAMQDVAFLYLALSKHLDKN